MKGIASKYTEQLHALDFPQKVLYTVVTLTDAQGKVIKDFLKGNLDQVREAGILLSSGTNLSNMMKCAKEKGLKWTEQVLPKWGQVLADYAKNEERIWYDFEMELTKAYLPDATDAVADEFYVKCWEFAKARSEDMGGIEELFEKFSEYLTK